MTNKPNKVLYENQNRIWNEAKRYLLDLLSGKKVVQEAIVWASLAEGKFGLYEEVYKNKHEGSDIDLVIIVDEFYSLPKKWKFTGVEKSCFDLYHNLGVFQHEGHKHIVDGLLVFPSRHSLQEVRNMLAERSKSIYVKSGISILKSLSYKNPHS